MSKTIAQLEARLERLEKELAEVKATLNAKAKLPWYRQIVGDFAGDVVRAYGKLEAVWRSFLKMNVLSLTAEAQQRFTELRQECPRLQTMDLRIASIALVTDAVLFGRAGGAGPARFSAQWLTSVLG